MSLPNQILPLLKDVARQSGEPLEFWKSNDPVLIDCYCGLASKIILSDIQLYELPRGYYLVTKIFDWESNCLMSGWYALENRASDIESIVLAFNEVGLVGEATAIQAAADTWANTEGDSNATGKAYSLIPNKSQNEAARFAYLFEHFKNNASELFYHVEK